MYLYVFYIIARDQHQSHQRISRIMYRSHISVYHFSIPAFAKYLTSLQNTDYSNNNFHLIDTQSPYISFDQGALCVTTLRQLLQTTLGEGISTCPFAMTRETELEWIRCIRDLDGEVLLLFSSRVMWGFEGFPSCMLEGIGVSTVTKHPKNTSKTYRIALSNPSFADLKTQAL